MTKKITPANPGSTTEKAEKGKAATRKTAVIKAQRKAAGLRHT
jgi:hypothetical protein